jgi:hypothetical protein
MAQKLEYRKWPMVPGARKKSQIACNPKARISLWLGRGCSVISLKEIISVPASLCGKPAGRLREGISRRELRRNLPFLHGDSAYEVGKYTLGGEGGQVMNQGKYIVIWKKQGGEWKLYRDIWNTSMPAPGSK